MSSVIAYRAYAEAVLARCQNVDVVHDGVCVMLNVETRTFKRLAFTADNEVRIDRMLDDGLVMLVGVYVWWQENIDKFVHWIEDDMRETARDFADDKRRVRSAKA